MVAAKGDFVLYIYPSTIQDITIIATPISTPSTKIYTFTLSDGELSSDGSYLIFGPDDLDTLGTWEFEISSTGYKSIKTQYTFLETSNFFLDVVLEPNPSTHTFVVKEGEPIKYIVMRDGYKTIEETVTLTSDMTIDIVMERDIPKRLAYACYKSSNDEYAYAIPPTETNQYLKLYTASYNDFSIALDAKQLSCAGNNVNYFSWTSVSEDISIYNGVEYKRDYENDLYINDEYIDKELSYFSIMNGYSSTSSGDVDTDMDIYVNGELYKSVYYSVDGDIPITVLCHIGDIVTINNKTNTSRFYFDGDSSVIADGESKDYTVVNTTHIIEIYLGVCCVPGYSQILLEDNTTKDAENIRIGDKIIGYNCLENRFESATILNVEKVNRYEMSKIIFEDDTYLEITPDHPIMTDNGWCTVNSKPTLPYKELEIHKLVVGYKILQSNGTYKSVKHIETTYLDEPLVVYTYNVTDGIDTYIADGCVVSNASCPI